MVMWFNDPNALNQLLTDQYHTVITVRPKMRRTGKEVLMYKKFGKRGELYVVFMDEAKDLAERDRWLSCYLDSSGFKTVDAWKQAAKDSRFFYLVYLGHVEERDEPCGGCNECMRVEDGRWTHNTAQWAYCNFTFGPGSEYAFKKSGIPMDRKHTSKTEILLKKKTNRVSKVSSNQITMRESKNGQTQNNN